MWLLPKLVNYVHITSIIKLYFQPYFITVEFANYQVTSGKAAN